MSRSPMVDRTSNDRGASERECNDWATRQANQPLVVGIGSHHGDDQAGWLLIDHLSCESGIMACLRKADVPHQLIDWSDQCSALHIIDACDAAETVMRMELKDASSLKQAGSLSRCHSSHHFGIVDVLELARLLGRLPGRVVFWGIPGVNYGAGQTFSADCQRHVSHCADLLTRELSRA